MNIKSFNPYNHPIMSSLLAKLATTDYSITVLTAVVQGCAFFFLSALCLSKPLLSFAPLIVPACLMSLLHLSLFYCKFML